MSELLRLLKATAWEEAARLVALHCRSKLSTRIDAPNHLLKNEASFITVLEDSVNAARLHSFVQPDTSRPCWVDIPNALKQKSALFAKRRQDGKVLVQGVHFLGWILLLCKTLKRIRHISQTHVSEAAPLLSQLVLLSTIRRIIMDSRLGNFFYIFLDTPVLEMFTAKHLNGEP